MSVSWKQQALIEAPVEDVWALISDPARFPEWSGDAIEVTGLPTKIELGSTYHQTSRGPLGMKATTVFKVEELDDLREIKVRCQTSGFYSRFLLTEAQGGTFADMEMGVEPHDLRTRLGGIAHTKGYIRRAAERALDHLRAALRHDHRTVAEK